MVFSRMDAAAFLLAVVCPFAVARGMSVEELGHGLLPQPQRLTLEAGTLETHGASLLATLSPGESTVACREVLAEAMSIAGARLLWRPGDDPCSFTIGKPCPLPALPEKGFGEGYVLRITRRGISARAQSERGLQYAAVTLLQLARLHATGGGLPALTEDLSAPPAS